MLKVHIYHGNGKSATIRASGMIGLTVLRQDSLSDKDEARSVRPKGPQLVQLMVTEEDGQLFISNLRTDERIKL